MDMGYNRVRLTALSLLLAAICALAAGCCICNPSLPVEPRTTPNTPTTVTVQDNDTGYDVDLNGPGTGGLLE